MLELLEILKECWEKKRCAAIATIVHKQGSTYRGIGAKSVILPDGIIKGTLSGGCVEGDIYEHAMKVMTSGHPQWIEYDFHGTGDAIWGLGVGCNGALKIWIEAFDPIKDPENALQTLHILQNQLSSITIISSNTSHFSVGAKLILGQDPIEFTYPTATGLFSIQHNEAEMEIYVEKLKPIPRLFIFGAGPDVVPLVQGAKLLQWLITIVDHRPGFANKERFPDADNIIVSPLGTFPIHLGICDTDYAVIMTHHFEQDSLYLQKLISFPLAYLGILGPKKRTTQLLMDKIVPAGVSLHSPIGLDIGAETPEEIAFSILSEMICHGNGSTGTPLRLQTGWIHSR